MIGVFVDPSRFPDSRGSLPAQSAVNRFWPTTE